MIRKAYLGIWLIAGAAIGLAASGRIASWAQEGGRRDPRDPAQAARPEPADSPFRVPEGARDPAATPRRHAATTAAGSIQDALLRPFSFPFDRPTALAQVCLHLKQTLGVPVVLDLAALDRQEIDPDDTVQLQLDGVRLKTGLKLLLDQVGLTYHVVPEDNLLIITDKEGSDDPLDRVWTELRSLHRDIHHVQEALDNLSESVYVEADDGPRVRKPTIIEEKPDRDPFDGPDEMPPRTGKPPQRPGASGEGPPASAPVPRSGGGRIPLGGGSGRSS